MPLSDLDQALLELAVQRGVLTETGVQRVREAVLAPAGPDVESAIFDLVDGATFQKLCKELPDFYARRLKAMKSRGIDSPTALAPKRSEVEAVKQWFGPKPAEAPPPTERIGRYTVEAELGRGALGVVYRVREDGTEKRFALKILSQIQDGTASQRFLREMKALSKVEHRNVVRIRDLGEDQGRPFYVMELVSGSALSELVEKKGPLEPEVVLKLARDMLEGLGAIHAQAITHRDVKPANILIDTSGRAVLIDFSVAAVADAGTALTKEGFSVGTPVYMAPEQVTGEPTGPFTDLYALGVTLFVALAGHSPYGALATYDALADAKLEQPPPPVTRAGVPHGLVRFVLRLMASEPKDRYASAALALAALEAEVAGEKKAPPLLGGYELLLAVSRSAGSTVYRARSVASPTLVALKALDAGASPLALARLTREARALGRVKHVNVVALHQGGIALGRSFLALEWIEGGSLAQLCKAGALPLETVFTLSIDLARALAAVHERNVLHRDVRPENVLVTGSAPGTPIAKLIDFGLAKIEGDEEEAPALMGAPAYASPEQLRGEPASRRSDLYALGSVIFFMATGRPPEPDARLETIRPEAAPLAPIVAALLAKDLEKRYASAAALADDLELMEEGNAPSALPFAPPPPSGSARPWWKVW